jgi:hypothetical protein
MVSGSAFADTFYFATPPPGVAWEGVYVNPYTANETAPQTINGLTIYCDDWDTEFSGNPTWNATVYAVTPGNVSNFRFGGVTTTQAVSLSGGGFLQYAATPASANAYDLYLEAVYLDQTMQTLDGGITQAQQEEISAAEWTLFTSSGAASLLSDINNSGSAFATAVYGYLVAAQNNYASVNPIGWDVITPVGNASNGGPMQEFLIDDFTGTINGPNVPEPSAFILLGTVVGLLGWTKLRRRQA